MSGVCWYCYWGWPKPIADIYLEAVAKLGGNNEPLTWGPSHVVWEDENFHLAEACLKDSVDPEEQLGQYELDVVRWSLEQLAKLPMELRMPPNDDEGEPSDNPPPADWVMVKGVN